jgi:glycosyltransferase involved in cell wall biosynthesis
MSEPCSLIIATYNWPQALHLCLESVLRQTILPDEIIIADDGSGEGTRRLIEAFTLKSPVPVLHVWQPDEGFQLARIRNKAIARAAHPYIIQIDGDLILHSHFVEDHLHLQEPNYFVTGSRVLMNEATTASLLAHQSVEVYNHYKGGKNFLNQFRNVALRNFLSKRYKINGRNRFYIKGCNMAFWRTDLLQINGYNEAFTGWGLEDSELAIRLINAGLRKKFLKMGGITYHLHHAPVSREGAGRNRLLMEAALSDKKITVPAGVSQHLQQASLA